MPFDNITLNLLKHQAEDMHRALHGNPKRVDQKRADDIQEYIDQILDGRPRVHGVAPDGEIVYDDSPAWIKAQVETIAVNATGQAEVVLPHTVFGSLEDQS